MTELVHVPPSIESQVAPEFLGCLRDGLACWRGVSRKSFGDDRSDTGVWSTFAKRRPRSMSLELTEACDEWFSAQFGWQARTEHTLFLTGRRDRADRFGAVAQLVLPLGSVRYLWSPAVADLVDYLASAKATPSDVPALLSSAEYRIDRISEALRSGNEIMVRCESYWWVASGL